MKLVPLGDRVVLKQLEAEETTKSGIVLPGQAHWSRSFLHTIVPVTWFYVYHFIFTLWIRFVGS